jgi:plastocyanin
MQNNKRFIQITVLIVLVLILVSVAWLILRAPSRLPQPPAVLEGQNVPTTSTPPVAVQTPSGATPSPAPTRSPAVPSSPAVPKITIVSPKQSDQWILGDQNTIQWNQAAGAPDGTITLVNGTTGAMVGWIQQHISPHQMTFPWNTGSIFVAKTSPLTENVPPGNYRIVLAFTSPNIPSVTSPVFSIISPAEAKTPAATVTIQGAAFSSPTITAKQGTKLTLINRDPASYNIIVSSRAPSFTIGTSSSMIFDTSILSPGTYVFYSEAYPSLHLTIVSD